MKRFAAAVAFVFSVAAITAGSAGTATSKSKFQVFVDKTTTASSKGLTLVSELGEEGGTFDVAAKTAAFAARAAALPTKVP